jgi:hypothetical protein
MLRGLAAIRYFLTALATLNGGVAYFDLLYRLISPMHLRWNAANGIGIFAIPAIFLLAGISDLALDKPKAPSWITSAVTVVVLMPILVSRQHGGFLYAEVAGPIVSIVVILGFSGLRPSTIAGIGACNYALVEGSDLVSFLESYFSPRTTGNSLEHFLAEVIPAALVISSLTIAFASIFRRRERMPSATPPKTRSMDE